MNRVHVISGSLSAEPLGEVLEALTLSRQLSCVEIMSPIGALEGAIWLKSGQILEVTAGTRSGIEALRYLTTRPGTYDVFRANGSVDGEIRPMMSVARALTEATSSPSEAPSLRLSTGTQAIDHTSARTHVSMPQVAVPPIAPANEAIAIRQIAGTPAPLTPATPRVPAVAYAQEGPEIQRVPATTPIRAARDPQPRAAAQASLSTVPAPSPTGNAGPVLAVFANKGGVGKTTFSLNLAVTLARRGMRVCLVDADPRNDVGTALAARRDTSLGLFDVLDGSMALGDVLLETAMPGFNILPAGGVNLPEDRFQTATIQAQKLAATLASLSAPGAIVIVDTPPGLRGITHSVLRASTHAVAIVQAEPIALRSAAAVPRALDSLPARERPALVGVVLNMLDRRVGASLSVLEQACRVFGADNVLDIAVPRSGVFVEASEGGAPVALQSGEGAHAIAWIFESLAAAILARAGLSTPKFSEMRLL